MTTVNFDDYELAIMMDALFQAADECKRQAERTGKVNLFNGRANELLDLREKLQAAYEDTAE